MSNQAITTRLLSSLHKHHFRLTLMAVLMLPGILPAQTHHKADPYVKWEESPLGDYLYLLFNRKTLEMFPDMDSLIGIRHIPTLDNLVALPEIVTSLQLTRYSDIYPVLKQYYKNTSNLLQEKPVMKKLGYGDRLPPYDSLLALVKRGEPFYDRFEMLWRKHIQPSIELHTATWRQQLTQGKVLQEYRSITRLTWQTDTLGIAALAYHLAGSANYSPTGIYTSLFKTPNLPWVIGHEGTHLLLTGPAGYNWMQTKQARRMARLAATKGTSLYEIEEAMCHFMQAQLSKACGTKPADFPIASRYEEGLLRNLLTYWESHWSTYRQGSSTIVSYLLEGAEVVLRKM